MTIDSHVHLSQMNPPLPPATSCLTCCESFPQNEQLMVSARSGLIAGAFALWFIVDFLPPKAHPCDNVARNIGDAFIVAVRWRIDEHLRQCRRRRARAL